MGGQCCGETHMAGSGFPSKVNIGCGFDKRPGFLNVDIDPACEPDVIITDLEFSALPRQSFDYVLALDVLEHIQRAYTMHALVEWADLLKLGGKLELETSNIIAVSKLMETYWNFTDHANFAIYMFGNQVHAGDFHHTGFTHLTLRGYLLSAGFEIEAFEERRAWLLWSIARKTLDWTDLLRSARDAGDADFVRAAYDMLLYRAPEEPFLSQTVDRLRNGESRRSVLKQLVCSPERCMRVAQLNGL